jgi:hypothetical protein
MQIFSYFGWSFTNRITFWGYSMFIGCRVYVNVCGVRLHTMLEVLIFWCQFICKVVSSFGGGQKRSTSSPPSLSTILLPKILVRFIFDLCWAHCFASIGAFYCLWCVGYTLHWTTGEPGTRDGNGEFPVGFELPKLVPATKKFPRGIPTNACGGHFFPIPVPRGDKSPSGIPITA